MRRVPLPFAIFYEILLIILSFTFPPLWIYAIINAIPLVVSFGKYEYENHEDFEKFIIPENTKAERELNKLFYKNHKIRLRYHYSSSTKKNKLQANEYFYQDICTSIYNKADIKKYISNKIIIDKNIFNIFQEFSLNYKYPPENLIQTINILDNQIRFLIVIFELYNIEIFEKNYDYKTKIIEAKNYDYITKIIEAKNSKKFWLNYLLSSLVSINDLLNMNIKATSISDENRTNVYATIKLLEENTNFSLTVCLLYFEELNDAQIKKIN